MQILFKKYSILLFLSARLVAVTEGPLAQLTLPIEERFSVSVAVRETQLKPVNGKKFSFDGKYSVLVFGFTGCVGVCPATLKLLEKILGAKQQLSGIRQVVFVSVDAKFETATRLKSFLGKFKLNAVGMMGSATATADFYARFISGRAGVLFSPSQHSSLLYIVSPDGRLKGIVSTEVPPVQIKRAVASLIKEDPLPSPK